MGKNAVEAEDARAQRKVAPRHMCGAFFFFSAAFYSAPFSDTPAPIMSAREIQI